MSLLQSIFSQLGINKTFFIQLVMVSICCIFMSKFVFDGLLNILVTRINRTRGAKKIADEHLFEYEMLKKEYEQEWSKYENVASEIKNSGYLAARIKAERILTESKQQAEKILGEARFKAETLYASEKSKILADAPGLIKAIREKLLQDERF